MPALPESCLARSVPKSNRCDRSTQPSRSAVLNNIHEALVDVVGHSDQTEILEKVAFSSPPSEKLQGSSTFGVLALQRLTNCALVPFCCFHPHGLSPPRIRLVPLYDLCRRVVAVFVLGEAYQNRCKSCGNRWFCFLETSCVCLSRALVPGGCSRKINA